MSPLWTAPVPAARRSGATAPSGAAHPARIGVAPPGFAMRAARHVEDDALVGEIDLDPVEQRQAVHAEQQRRALVEAERLDRSEEHTAELQSQMCNPYAVFLLTNKTLHHHAELPDKHVSTHHQL